MFAAKPTKRKPSRPVREPAASDQGCAAALEFCEDAVVCLDDSGTVLTWNRGASNLYGYSPEEILGQPMNVLAPADRAPQQRAIFEKVLAGESVQQFETVHLRKTGTRVEVSLSACPMRQKDRIVGVCQVARGISDRKLLESAAAQLTAIVESSEDPIFSADPAGLIRTWNAEIGRAHV